jgi:hypothetical protein
VRPLGKRLGARVEGLAIVVQDKGYAALFQAEHCIYLDMAVDRTMPHDIGNQFLNDDSHSRRQLFGKAILDGEIQGMGDRFADRLRRIGKGPMLKGKTFHARAENDMRIVERGGNRLRIPIIPISLSLLVLAAPAAAEVGRVKSSVGAVQVVRGGAPLAVRPGLRLEQGDVVATGKTGRVGIAFIDDTRFAVGPNSRITLTEFGYDRTRQTGSFVTKVDRGSLGVVSGRIAKSKRDAMKVRTPTSMLGVRGTKFVVEIQ